MVHQMKLEGRFFDYIQNGTKRIELRLYDENKSIWYEGLKVKVCGLLRYNSFSDLFKDFDISILADKSMTKKELLDVLQGFYTPEEQKKYGILGIRIEKL